MNSTPTEPGEVADLELGLPGEVEPEPPNGDDFYEPTLINEDDEEADLP